jgi:hypothetical protein
VPFKDSPYKTDKKRAQDGAKKKRVQAGCIIKKKGDWAWFKQFMNLVGWRPEGVLRRMCYICFATMGGVNSCLDSSLGAGWRNTMALTHAEYMADLRARGYVSEVWNLPGFRHTMLVLDLMHIACLGILQYLLGNVLLLQFHRLGGTIGDPNDALTNLLRFTKLAARNLGIQNPVFKLTLNMIRRTGENPRLRTKAAETRRMLYCVHWILVNILPPRDDFETLVFQCVAAIYEFYTVLEHWDHTTSPARATIFGT